MFRVLMLSAAAIFFPHGAVAEDAGDVIRYVDFSAPEHTIGALPAAGIGPKFITGVSFGAPTVRAASGVMGDRPLEFDAVASYEQIFLDTPRTAATYDIECDVAGHALRNSNYAFTVMLGTPHVRSVDLHGYLNQISVFEPGLVNQASMPYADDHIYHLAISVDLASQTWRVSVDGVEIHRSALDATYMAEVVFTLSPAISGTGDAPAPKVAVDNIRITTHGIYTPPSPVLHPEPFPAPRLSTVNFDGPPAQPGGSQVGMNSYVEQGFVFKPSGPIDANPPYRMIRNGGGSIPYPENGTAYLQLSIGDSLEVYESSGHVFQPISVDLAEYSTIYQMPTTIGFRGTKKNGEEVTVEFVTDGLMDGIGNSVDFQSFYFPDTFTDLVRLEATSGFFSLDNLVLRVPAPTSSPTPSPTPVSEPVDLRAPHISVFGSSRRRVQSRYVFLFGAVSDDRKISRVEIQTGKGPYLPANLVGNRWSQTLALPRTRNVFRIRAIDVAGNVCPSKLVTVIRETRFPRRLQ